MPGEVSTAPLDLEGPADTQPEMLVCHLPARLGAALETLFFVAACLGPGQRDIWRRIVLLTDFPSCWLFDALYALTEDASAAGRVEAISLRREVAALQAVLTGDVRAPLAAQTHRLWRCALTAAELQVLRALLCRQQSFLFVARARGTEINTVKSQKQSAFLKLRVHSWSGALNWCGDGY
jgi:DNA-binding NarL/FixJ family response regulator